MRRWIVALGVAFGLLFSLARMLGDVYFALAIAVAIALVCELSMGALMGVRDRRGLLAIALLDVVTVPVFCLAVWELAGGWHYPWPTVGVWVAVLLVEWGVLLRVLDRARWRARRALALVIATNLTALGGWYVALVIAYLA